MPTESTKRQYALRQRAVALGWPEDRIIVLDNDLGQSGASAVDREGFQRLVTEVSLGRAGIVLGLEVSRLARNSTDWHRLLEICALTDTLILDEDGIYDPAHFNDRLLLGFKGTMSEAELHVLRARLHGGILNKARRGELVISPPVGLIYNSEGALVLDPDKHGSVARSDERVRITVQLVLIAAWTFNLSSLPADKHHFLPIRRKRRLAAGKPVPIREVDRRIAHALQIDIAELESGPSRPLLLILLRVHARAAIDPLPAGEVSEHDLVLARIGIVGYDNEPARWNRKEGREWKVLLNILSDHQHLIGIVTAKPNQFCHTGDSMEFHWRITTQAHAVEIAALERQNSLSWSIENRRIVSTATCESLRHRFLRHGHPPDVATRHLVVTA
jgi:DNA invertase Pin-like site-specific DNA recombinase